MYWVWKRCKIIIIKTFKLNTKTTWILKLLKKEKFGI